MNQRVLVALTITAIILGAINLTLLLVPDLLTNISPSQSILNPNQKIPLEVTYLQIQNATDYYNFQVYVSLPNVTVTLFDCCVKIDYLTESNVWKTISKNIGIVDYSDHVDQGYAVAEFQLDAVFKNDNPYERHDYMMVHYYGSNIKVEAYGYLQP